MNVTFPFQQDKTGRTRLATHPEHVRDLIEQLLFTSPGERVNRPNFGSGILQMVFAPNNTALNATTQSAIHGALQQYLGDMILIDALNVHMEDASVQIEISYTIRGSNVQETATFERTL